MRERSGHRNGRPKGARVELPRYDQALRAAANAGKKVKIYLAVDSIFAPEGFFEGLIQEVDKYDLKVAVEDPATFKSRSIWVKKAMIVGTEVL